MIPRAPTLSARDLEDELQRVHARPRGTLTTAFFGTPAPGLDAVSAQVALGDERVEGVRFRVVHVGCELQLREALAEGGREPLVLLLDFDQNLPLDITGRLAGGRVRPIADDRRVARLFGALMVSGEVLASPLKRALLAEPDARYAPVPGTTLDLDTAWRRYLERMVGLPAEAPLSEERLLAHAATAADPRGFRAALAENVELRAALHRYIEARAGALALLGWQAWERDAGVQVAALAFVLQGTAASLGTGGYLDGRIDARLVQLDAGLKNATRTQRRLLDQWANLADPLSLQLTDDAALERVLAVADRIVADDDLGEHVAGSRYLLSALQRGKERLAQALEAALAAPGQRALEQVRQRLKAVDDHRLRAREPHKRQAERARMAARLVGFAGGLRLPDATVPSDVVAELAGLYAREGGFVDWARSVARGPEGDRLDAAVAAVVAHVDGLRDAMDERFARALPEWLARRKTDRVVPIEQALDRFAAAFLAEQERRRLMIVLLDGMAWANAVELVLDLEDQRWGPIRWQPPGTAGELLPPMLASLPTLTEVSRAAFFSGRAPVVGDRRPTSEDPSRFDDHAGLRKVQGGGPRLLLRAETEDRSGHASKQALELIASEDRVVAFVVNAIDDQLKVGPGLEVAYRADTIKALPDLLGAAAHARRAVLLVADHGHVRGDRFEGGRPVAQSLSARARELGPGDEPLPNELVLESDGAWRAKARNRLGVFYRETDTYTAGHQRGSHGGASLAEVVTPALLVAADELRGNLEVDDHALDLRSFPRPRWWDLEVGPVVATSALPAPPRKEKPPEKPKAQLTIPAVVPPPPEPAPAAVVAGTASRAAAATARSQSRWATLLRGSEIYRRADKKEQALWESLVIPIVDLVAEHDGTVGDDVLAARLGLPRFRVRGPVNEASERLNIEQYLVLVRDPHGTVRLDGALLEQLFAT